MKNIDIKLPKPCPITCISPKLPNVLYKHITKKINRINEILSNPVKYKEECEDKKHKIPQINILGYSEVDDLNNFSDIVEKLTTPKMIEVWNKCYKLNQSSLPMLFEFIKNRYYGILDKSAHQPQTEEDRRLKKHLDKYCILLKDPSELISATNNLISLLKDFDTLIRPDGADCFEHKDISDPENKIFLVDGEIPYRMDWNLYITDEEYDVLMDTLHKLLEKLNNRKRKNQTEYQKSLGFLFNPATRKKKITKASEILMIRALYVRFIELFNKPMYKEISIIVSELFQGEYTENEIIKFTRILRDRIKTIKDTLQKDGLVRLYDSTSLEEAVYKYL